MEKSVILSVFFCGKISQLDEIVIRKPDKTWIIDGFGGFLCHLWELFLPQLDLDTT
jgi:hypothetical protein